jgi:hypothetical protein
MQNAVSDQRSAFSIQHSAFSRKLIQNTMPSHPLSLTAIA